MKAYRSAALTVVDSVSLSLPHLELIVKNLHSLELPLSRPSLAMPFQVQRNRLSRVFELPTCGSKADMGLPTLVLLASFLLVSDQSHEAN